MHDGSFCAVRWLVIGPDHPALAGHFPGQPVLPGVVLIDLAIRLLQQEFDPRAVVVAIPAVKFLHPVLPGAALLVGVELVEPDRAHFVCCVGQQMAARGSLRLSGGLST